MAQYVLMRRQIHVLSMSKTPWRILFYRVIKKKVCISVRCYPWFRSDMLSLFPVTPIYIDDIAMVTQALIIHRGLRGTTDYEMLTIHFSQFSSPREMRIYAFYHVDGGCLWMGSL